MAGAQVWVRRGHAASSSSCAGSPPGCSRGWQAGRQGCRDTRGRHRTRAEAGTGRQTEPAPKETFDFDNKQLTAQQVVDMLAPFMTEQRAERISRIVANRTRNVLPIVEGLYDMGNLAAVCRSADAFGMAAVHAINKGDSKYKQSSRTAAGADKWLDVTVWNGESSTAECLSHVKAAGYQVVVTHLRQGSVAIQDIDWTKKTAFVLGNERDGVSEEAVAAADVCAVIEMDGFVESFNISVAAALCMYEARAQRQCKLGKHGDLTPQQAEDLRATLMLRAVKDSPTLIRELLSRPPMPWQQHNFV